MADGRMSGIFLGATGMKMRFEKGRGFGIYLYGSLPLIANLDVGGVAGDLMSQQIGANWLIVFKETVSKA